MNTNRYNTKKCKACGTVTSIMAEKLESRLFEDRGIKSWVMFFRLADGQEIRGALSGTHAPVVACRKCGRQGLLAFPVQGKVVADKGCDGRCMSATGHNCECSCGGHNHGAAHGAAA